MSHICIYNGEGSSEESVEMLLQSLQNICKNYTVELISPEVVRQGKWMRSAALLAVGGGYDLGYIRALKSDGLKIIKTYVEQGGSYLGICAGAYLACRRIEFDKGGNSEVCRPRHLGFFPGVAVGPTFPGFVYNSEAGAYATEITTNVEMDKKLKFGNNISHPLKDSDCMNHFVYFNGGCHFVLDDDASNDVDIIARYNNVQDSHQSAAVVRCRVGKGTAILSGPHFEYIADKLDTSNIYLKEVIPKLKESFHSRQLFYRLVLGMLKMSRL